jgi:hypothetical protein
MAMAGGVAFLERMSQQEAQANLQGILDRLGPGAWLAVDRTWMWCLFREGGVEAARRFAESSDCCFVDDGGGVGRFGRAYFKDAGVEARLVPASPRASG